MVQVHLLGQVGVTSDRGEPVDVGPAKCRALLATLAWSVGEAVPVSRLVDAVWGEDPPRTADKTLQGYVARLRKGLGPAAIVRLGAAYRLDLTADAVDVTRFRRHLAAGDLEAALATWTGAPLSGLEVPGLSAAVDGLVEQWLTAVEDDLARRIVTEAAAAIVPLTELTAAYPFREGLWALLMTALYRAGRQADALAAYQRARRHLVEELGVEPGPGLREVEERILAHDDSLGGGPASPGAGRSRPTGTVTFGFADVARATRLWAEQRRKMPLAMSRLDALVREVAERHAGTVLASVGENVAAVFSRADDAAAWATELQVEADHEPWPGGIELRLQIGLHTGETEEHDGGYFGPAVHTAARLAAAGHGGQTLMSGVTAALLERDDLRGLGAHRLQGAVAEHDIVQLGGGDHPPLKTASTRRGNLPRRLGRLWGREDDLDAVAEALDASPVVTLTGPGGIGKTALALAAAHRWQGDSGQRVWLVELAELTDAGDVARAVSETLGVSEGSKDTLTDSAVAALRGRPTLLVLDNCEHVIDGAAALARAVADHAPETRVLATSRQGLGIAHERLVVVSPLDPAGAAVELFAERARAVTGHVDVDASWSEVVEICRRLDGMPLAIELAAARTQSMTPSQLLHRLDDGLRLLTGGRRTGAERHRTLRATIGWSYRLLSPEQQLLFRRLSVFTGPFDLTAAETIAAVDEMDKLDVDNLLRDLVEHSLVTVEAGAFGRRFRLLDTLRQFAAEHLAAAGDVEDAALRHARWCCEEVARIHDLLTGAGEVEGVALLGQLSPNLRSAVHWACARGDAALADALVRPIATEVMLRRQAEIGDWAERILQITPRDHEAAVVLWLGWALIRHMQAGRHDAYERVVQRYGHADHPLIRFTQAYLSEDGVALWASSPVAASWLRQLGEGHAGDVIELFGEVAGLMTMGRFPELDTVAAAMATRFRTRGAPTLLHFTLGMLGYSARFQGKEEEASHLFVESAGVDVPTGTHSAHRAVEARAVFDQGDRVRAYRMLRDEAERLLDTDYVDGARLVAVEFANIMADSGHVAEAARALAYLDTTGDFGVLARETLVARALSKLTASPHGIATGPGLDARQTLTYMRDVLNELVHSH